MILRRSLVAVVLAVPLAFAASRAHAQAYPCNGPGPGEIMVGMAPGSNGVAPTPLCAPAPGSTGPTAPAARMPDIYMTVITHPDTRQYWFASGYGSAEWAEKEALEKCKQAMGEGCVVNDTWSNDARIVVVEDAVGNVFAKGGPSFFKAWMASRDECDKYSSGCHKIETLQNALGGGMVIASKSDGARRPWGAVARPKTKAPEPLDDTAWLATGGDGFKAAEDAAVKACEQATKLECQVRISAGGGYIARMVNNKGAVEWFNAPTLDMLDKGIRNNCGKGETCRLVDTFDVRPKGLSTLEISVSKAPARGFFAMARPVDDSLEKSWNKRAIVTGQSSLEAAQSAAVALCEKESRGKCEAAPKDGDDGVDQFVLLTRASSGDVRMFLGTSADDARNHLTQWCDEKHLTCPTGPIADLAKKNKGSLLDL
ncbi:MAG: hypothetical protein GAK28_03501 [Luteibacter sp.]|uniref:DUF4189 domain-containing protein n=1 Tax=Luteibacter sp. TaxID=1886636 RepID=UPI00137E50F4|nr:DUF4189 domain-containing protein [Luteibacter sp.]KAF1005058.1 MAG: hypothetical protein GAK28_03501 [Luteibacter sp.]